MNGIQCKILIAGGGTGGHISPGIALYEECVSRGIECFLLVGEKDRKFNYLREVDSKHLLFYRAPNLTLNPLKFPFFIIRFIFSVLIGRKILSRKKIDHVIGMGGYVSAPVLTAAKLSRVPYWLCEQNTVPGKVTLRFAKNASEIFTTFDQTKQFVKPLIAAKCRTTGNPVRKRIFVDSTVEEARKMFSLDHCSHVLLVIGGSQGALALNELVVAIKTKYSEEFSRIGIIWCTGAQSFEKYRALVQEQNNMGSMYISPFVEDVGSAYRACDLAIARSGAGVMAELALMGVPSILIPYPFAADDHQSKNADVFANSGASVKIDGKNAAVEKIAPLILDMMSSSQKLMHMSKKALAEARKDAAEQIIGTVIR